MLRSLLVLLLLGAAPAQAQVLTLGRSGSWTAFGGARQDGQRVCGIALRGEGRSVHFTYAAESPAVTVELFRRGWDIPQRMPVPVLLQPGSLRTATLPGEGLPREGRLPARVAAPLPYEGSQPFWRALRTASLLRVHFTSGHERLWTVATPGSAGAVGLLAECLRRMGAATDPVSDAAPRRR